MLAPWNVDTIGAPQWLSPFFVRALKLNAFAFTSISDAIEYLCSLESGFNALDERDR